MKFRKLRIAWSVIFGALSVLLIVLWVWSCSWQDIVNYSFAPYRGFALVSGQQRVILLKYDQRPVAKLRAVDFKPEPGLSKGEYPATLLPPQNSPPFFTVKTRPYRSTEINLPYRVLVLLSATIAAVPWIMCSKRFSLRTLLIVMTAASVALALFVGLSRQ